MKHCTIPHHLIHDPRFVALSPTAQLVHLALRTLVDPDGKARWHDACLAHMGVFTHALHRALEENRNAGLMELWWTPGGELLAEFTDNMGTKQETSA